MVVDTGALASASQSWATYSGRAVNQRPQVPQSTTEGVVRYVHIARFSREWCSLQYTTSAPNLTLNLTNLPPPSATADIVTEMVRAVKEGRDVDLNEIKRNACVRYSLAKAPKLVEIIAAVPDEMVRDAREEERREEERK